jgi:hypothetical protein
VPAFDDAYRDVPAVSGQSSFPKTMEIVMNEESFNLSMRKFLKMVGVSSQNEIEKAVAKAIADGVIKGNESLPARMTLEIGALKLNVKFEGQIILG